jgi:ankyrin repeat protein
MAVVALVLMTLLLIRLRPFFLTAACNRKNVAVARLLLAMGTDPNTGTEDDVFYDFLNAVVGGHPFGAPPAPLLMVAVGNRQVAMVKLLLDRGAYVDYFADGGITSLCVAQDEKDDAIIKLLRARGANPDIGCRKG